MPTDWIPGAVRKPISFYKDAGRFTHAPLGWILHVVVGNGSPFNGFNNSRHNNPRFSHGWVAKSGKVEQYAPLSYKSWAQESGNSTYWSFETEGYPNEPLTQAQISSLGKIHKFLGTVDALASRPGQKGVGTHYMGGKAWGGHTCPDPSPGAGPRSHQRAAIIAAAHTSVPPSTEEDMGQRAILIKEKSYPAVWLSVDCQELTWVRDVRHEAIVQAAMKSRLASPVVTVYEIPDGELDYYGVRTGVQPAAGKTSPAPVGS